MSVREDLIAAKALIDTPDKWGQEEYEPRPGCYCIFGAIAKAKGVKAAPRLELGHEAYALRMALPSEFLGGVVDYNDDLATTHADIMALFDRAIEAAK